MPKSLVCLFISLLLLMSCAGSRFKLHPWEKLPKAEYTIPPYSKHLAKFKIALDPGHGGNADIPGYKRGPTGKREAVMNLNVAFFLKQFLESAGATVFMTRVDERFVALQERASMAAAAGSDFMISLHHNASNNPETNYAAVFYHLTPDHSPVSMDLARNIYFGLVDALHLPQVLEGGLLTDRLFYPAGFGVLRRSTIPAILLESSFYSNPFEEKRLTDLNYNRREAYGIFLGLARWAAGGVPSAQKRKPVGISTTKQPLIEYELFDGISQRGRRSLHDKLIFTGSVDARIDGARVPVTLSGNDGILSFAPDSILGNGAHTVQVDFENLFKNHNLPRTDTFIVAAPADSINFLYTMQYLPADTFAVMPILLKFFDSDGTPIWDSTRVSIRADKGAIMPETPQLRDGRVRVYYRAHKEIGLVQLIASTPAFSDTLLLSLTPRGRTWIVSGTVLDGATDAPVETATVRLNDSTWTVTDKNGFYSFFSPPTGFDTLSVERDGYAQAWQSIQVDSMRSLQAHFRLKPNFDGLLHGEVVILDAALGDSATADFFSDSLSVASVNFEMVQQLAAMLRWAGAKPVLVRERNEWLSAPKRIDLVNAVPEGWYLKFSYENWESDSVFVQATIYPANKVGEKIASSIVGTFAAVPNVQGSILQNTEIPEVTLTNKTALEVRIRCREPEILKRDLSALFRGIVEHYLVEHQASAKQAE